MRCLGSIVRPLRPSACALAGIALSVLAASASAATIDEMHFRTLVSSSYSPASGIRVMEHGDYYLLSDGSTWNSGAGTTSVPLATIASVQVIGSTIRYTLDPPAGGVLFQNTDYNSGDHSSQGSLGPAGPLVIEAQVGSTTGTLSGVTEILSNDETWYGQPRFNFYSANVGDVVPFDMTYELLSGTTFTTTLFDNPFTYRAYGAVYFTSPPTVPVVPSTTVVLAGVLAAAGYWRLRRPKPHNR